MGMCLGTKKYESHSKRPSLGKGGGGEGALTKKVMKSDKTEGVLRL